eukprot:5179959-Karenia_brevis.AAC.1
MTSAEAGKSGQAQGYLPHKTTVPKTLGDKVENWRMWKEDVMDFLDTSNPGMKELLKTVEKETDLVTKEWLEEEVRMGRHVVGVAMDGVRLWRALKGLTEAEARKIVTSVEGECGFTAWQKLSRRFEPSIAAREGRLMAEFSGLVAKPAKTPNDLKQILTEMERKVKEIKEMGMEVSESHERSVLIGVLDP